MSTAKGEKEREKKRETEIGLEDEARNMEETRPNISTVELSPKTSELETSEARTKYEPGANAATASATTSVDVGAVDAYGKKRKAGAMRRRTAAATAAETRTARVTTGPPALRSSS